MPRAARHFFCIACALYLSGLHWAVLQTTAWTGMMLARASRAGVEEAMRTTFDGEHPCRLCSAITVGQKEEKEQEPEIPMLKQLGELKLVAMVRLELPMQLVTGEEHWVEFSTLAVHRVETPPIPPPRV